MSTKVYGEITKNSFMDSAGHDDISDHIDSNVSETVNIVVIGNKFVGKTSLLFRLTSGGYTDTYMPTIGLDHKDKVIETNKGKKVNVKIWDTSGDERSREEIATNLYRFADGIIIMYDVTDIKSYNDVYHWLKLVDNHALSSAKLVFIANKVDLTNEREINKTDGIYLASSYGGKYMETSVLKNHNIDKMFRKMVNNITEKR